MLILADDLKKKWKQGPPADDLRPWGGNKWVPPHKDTAIYSDLSGWREPTVLLILTRSRPSVAFHCPNLRPEAVKSLPVAACHIKSKWSAPCAPASIYTYKAELCGPSHLHHQILLWKNLQFWTPALTHGCSRQTLKKMLVEGSFNRFLLRAVKMRCSSTCGCAVVEEDLVGWKSPFPNDELIKGPRHIMAVRLVVARSNEKVGVRVTVALRDVATGSIASGERSIDVDLQTIAFSPCEENMSPIRPWMRGDTLVSHQTPHVAPVGYIYIIHMEAVRTTTTNPKYCTSRDLNEGLCWHVRTEFGSYLSWILFSESRTVDLQSR